jgi:hypothetical protein
MVGKSLSTSREKCINVEGKVTNIWTEQYIRAPPTTFTHYLAFSNAHQKIHKAFLTVFYVQYSISIQKRYVRVVGNVYQWEGKSDKHLARAIHQSPPNNFHTLSSFF